MGKEQIENKITKLSDELQKKGYTVRFSEGPRDFYANALLTRELDDLLVDTPAGSLIVVENYALLSNMSLCRELYLGGFIGYRKGTVGDNWLGHDKTITIDLGPGRKVTLTGDGITGFGRPHIFVNENSGSIFNLRRTEEFFDSTQVSLNVRNSYAFTRPELIKSRLLLSDQGLLKSYLAEYEKRKK